MANLSSYINISANTVSASGNIASSVFSGNGSALTSLTGANVTGTVPAANVTVNAVMSLVSNNQEYRPVLATNTAGNLPFKGSAGISWNPSTYALTAGQIKLGSGIGGQGVTGTYAYGGNVSWAIQSQNGTGVDAQGQEIGRFGSEYNTGSTTFWDSYITYYQGSGANSGWLIINAAGNAVANVTGQGIQITGYVSATGNVTASGTGTNMIRRAGTIGAANTAVTLDNIQARLGGTPVRLYINTVSGNMTAAGTSQTMITGSIAISSWINVPIGEGAANAFAMSGAVSTNGDTAVLNITDQGAGSGTWRVTGLIANTTSNLYSISIERLV